MSRTDRNWAVVLDEALRRLAASGAQAPGIGAVVRAAKRAAIPVRRAVIGPRCDGELQRLVARLAARPVAPPSLGRPLHVGLLCVFGDEPVGGISVWSRMLAAALAKRGHRVSLFHLARTRDDPHVEKGVRFVPVPASPIRRWPPLPSVSPWLQDYLRAATDAVLREHEQDPFDVVSGPIYLVEALPLARSGAVACAVSLHTNESVNAAQGLPSPAGDAPDHEKRAFLDAERELLETAPILIGNSVASTTEILAASGLAVDPLRVHVVAHGMPDVAGTVPLPPASTFDGVKLVFVGRLGARKGIDTLLQALPVAVGSGAFSVDIAGAPDGHDPEPAFRARHAGQPWLDRVRFHGGVDDATKWTLIAGCDVAVIPSRYESFGLVAVEAMMFGKPVISTRVGGIPEVVEDGVTGLLFPPGDADALAIALHRLIGDADLRARMGRAGREHFVTRFTDTAMADAWVSAIRAGLARMAARRVPDTQ